MVRSSFYGQLMATCCSGGQLETALELFGSMGLQGLRPDGTLFLELVTALAGAPGPLASFAAVPCRDVREQA